MRRFAKLPAVMVTVFLAAGFSAGAQRTSQRGKKLLSPEIVTSGGRGQRSAGGIFKLTWRPGTDQIAFLRTEGAGRDAKIKLILHDADSGKEQDIPQPPAPHPPPPPPPPPP